MGGAEAVRSPPVEVGCHVGAALAAAEQASKDVDVLPDVCFVRGKAEERLWLNKEFGADVCDMEAAAILLTCDRNDVPCLMVKTVADSVRGGAAEYWNEKGRTAMTCLDIVDKLIDEM